MFLNDCPVQIVRTVAQHHLRQLHAHAHPIRGEVIEVVEVNAAHSEGAQPVEAKVGRVSPLPAAMGGQTSTGAHGVTRPTCSATDTAAARTGDAFGKMLEASPNQLTANRLGDSMKYNPCFVSRFQPRWPVRVFAL